MYTPQHKVRIVTAAALFDGHDAAINIMRRIMQSTGAEVIHLGHNRSAAEIVDCAIQEDAQGIAVTSYQGGYIEFFKYMYDLLKEKGCSHIRIFGGGGGTILPVEIEELHAYGITRIYSPDDGRKFGLGGMIEDVIKQCDFETVKPGEWKLEDIKLTQDASPEIAKAITFAENYALNGQLAGLKKMAGETPVLGITGTGGAGKSSVTDELVRRFLNEFEDKTIAVISVDPSKKKTGGALLGDRIRMNSIHHPRAYMRSLATRESDKAISLHIQEAIDICKAAAFNFIILETSGIGQSDTAIVDYCDVSLYVMTPEYGAASQLEKINMLDYADLIAINKFDKAGALDALHDVRKQYKRNNGLWEAKDEDLPVVGTIASQFNDPGVNQLFGRLMHKIAEKTEVHFGDDKPDKPIFETSTKSLIIPPSRVRYLAEIGTAIEEYSTWVNEQCTLATQWYQVDGVLKMAALKDKAALEDINKHLQSQLHADCKALITGWPAVQEKYTADNYAYQVRDKIINLPLYTESLSHSRIPKISLPQYKDWGDILRWQLTENLPGEFPYAAGVFPLKREGEDPTRMFAGEGGPERTNKRFHYVSVDQPAKRLSTAKFHVMFSQDLWPHH